MLAVAEPLIGVINAGSSSLKFSFYEGERRILTGQVDGIGARPSASATGPDGEKIMPPDLGAKPPTVPSEVLPAILPWAREQLGGRRLAAVGHRVVHGGLRYSRPARVTPELLAELEALVPLAPLHEPYNLAPIKLAMTLNPELPQVACFDTAFHRTAPEVDQAFALPYSFFEQGVRRYGFHGLSYEYIASHLPEVAPEIAKGQIIVAHLGSGASLCALHDGKSVDTTMGFTAVEGLCMGTRPGSIDPGAVLYLFQNLGLSVKEVEAILYKKSGLIGISGISNDMRDLLGREEPEAKLAVDYFIYRISKEIGALAAALGGVDALVFTAGIGENSPEIRRRVCEASAWLGLQLDQEANEQKADRISTSQSKISIWVIPTNEELMIALHTGTLLGLRSQTAEQAA